MATLTGGFTIFAVMGAVYSQFMLPPFNPDYPSQPYENPPPPMNYPSFPPPPPPQQEQPQHNYTSPQYNTIPFRLPSQYPSQQSSYTPVQATSPMPPYYGPQSNYSANTSPMYRPTNPSYPQNFTPYPFRPSQTEYAQTSVNYSMPYDSPIPYSPYPSFPQPMPYPTQQMYPPPPPLYPPPQFPSQSYAPPPYGPYMYPQQSFAPQSFLPQPPYPMPQSPYYGPPFMPQQMPISSYPYGYPIPGPVYPPPPVYFGMPIPSPFSAPPVYGFPPTQSVKPHYRILGTPSNFFLTVNNVSSNTFNPSYSGLVIELLDALSATAGFTYSFGLQPDYQYGTKAADGSWSGLIRSIIDGKADIAAADLSITADREYVIDFTLPFYQYSLGMLVNKQYGANGNGIVNGNGNGNGVSYLIKNTANTVFLKNSPSPRHQAIWDNISKQFPGSYVESDAEGIQKVLHGPYAYIMESHAVNHAMNLFNGQLFKAQETFPAGYFAFAVPQGSPIREKLSWAIAKLMENGQLQTILNKYISTSQ